MYRMSGCMRVYCQYPIFSRMWNWDMESVLTSLILAFL